MSRRHLAWFPSALLLVSTLVGAAAGSPTRPRVQPQAVSGDGTQAVLEALASWRDGSPVLAPQAAVRVNGMPSTFGADVGSPQPASWIGRDNIVWGNVVGGTGPYTYNFHFDDGSPDVGGVVSDPRYIRTHHTYTTLGPKFVTLTVTDNLGDSDAETFRIDVGPYGIDSRVQAAIEDGLRYLYLTQPASGNWQDYYGEADGLHALAFQLRGHDKNNNPDTDIYAETLQAYWNYTFGSLTPFAIGMQPAGNPDTNGNGIAVYGGSYTEGYNHGILMMAIGAIRDLTEVITVGGQAGRTIADVLQDMVDLAAYAQTEGGVARGGWQYVMLTSSYGSDNSAVQWVVLGLIAAEERGLIVPAFVKTELEVWTLYSQSATGGFGYTGVAYWENIAKTGAGLVQLGWLGYPLASPQVQTAINFLNTRWAGSGDGFSYPEHFGNATYVNSYATYAVKKGMEEFQPGGAFIGAHDWQDEYNKFLVHDPASDFDGIGGTAFNTDIAEQTFGVNDLTDGSWRQYDYWLNTGDYALATAVDVLILTEGVLRLVPVAACTVNPPQTAPGGNVNLSAAGSFHQDPNHQIVSYLWDFDDSDGVDFVTPDGSGISVNTSYALAPGELSRTFNITLRVADDAVPQVERDTRCTVLISRDNNPPVAVPGGPYSACVGDEICVDGSASYDPDAGDFVAAYHWDLDGDGQFDDFDGPATCVTFGGLYDGFIGLQVVDSFGVASQNAGAVVRIFTALGDLATASGDLMVTENYGCFQGAQVCVSGTYRVVSDDPSFVVPSARVDFFVDDPNDPAQRFATFVDHNLVDGMVVTHSACFARLDDQPHTVHMVVDPGQTVNECIETDNAVTHGAPCEPIPVLMSGFTVRRLDDGAAVVHWEAQVLDEAVAFHVYRQVAEAQPLRITDQPITGDGSYELRDPAAPATGALYWVVARVDSGLETWFGPVALAAGALPTLRLEIGSNPFRAGNTIAFALPDARPAELVVYNLAGRQVAVLASGAPGAGRYVVGWDGRGQDGSPVAAGVYVVQLRSGNSARSEKLVLLR